MLPYQKMIKELLEDYETIIVHIRKHLDEKGKESIDVGTTDFFIDL